jgi:hypothetical protein
LFELTGFAGAGDMSDVSHYYAGFLQRLAGMIDRWLAATEDGGHLSLPAVPVGMLMPIGG